MERARVRCPLNAFSTEAEKERERENEREGGKSRVSGFQWNCD